MRRDLILLPLREIEASHPAAYPNACRDCRCVEELLATDPQRAATRVKVRRLAFARPRAIVVDARDANDQGFPVLIFGDGPPPPADAYKLGSAAFITDACRILELLSERHGFQPLSLVDCRPHAHDKASTPALAYALPSTAAAKKSP